MKLKKIISVFLCVLVIFSLAACGNNKTSESGDNPSQTTNGENVESGNSETGSDPASPSDDSSAEGKTETEKEYSDLVKDVKKVWDDAYDYGKLTVGSKGTTLSNSFFDWTVNSVEAKKTVNGKSAGTGHKYVIINITVKNTTDYDFPTGNYDFLGIVGTGEDDELDTVQAFYKKMYPNEATLKAGTTLTGDLIIKVKSDVNAMILDYEEFYEDETTGNTYWFDLTF